MKYITVKLTEDQVKEIIHAVHSMRNTYKSIVKNYPNDNDTEKLKLAFLQRINYKLFKSIGL